MVVTGRRLSRRTGPNKKLRAGREFQVVTAFNEDRACARARANGRANSCAFTASGNRADDSANRAANGRSLHSAGCLTVVVLHITFMINAQRFAIRKLDAVNGSSEVIAPAVAQPDALEIERHIGSSSQASGTVRARHYAFDHRAAIASRLGHAQREAVTFARLFGAQPLIEPGSQLGPIRYNEGGARRRRVRPVAVKV